MDLLLTFVAAIAVFLVMRVVNLWYFKINEKIEIMNVQTVLLEKIFKAITVSNNNPETDTKKILESIPGFSKSNNVYELNSGEKYTVINEGETYYLIHAGKKYYYSNIKSAELSLTEISKGKEPSKIELIQVKTA